jgi:hypothetical protein
LKEGIEMHLQDVPPVVPSFQSAWGTVADWFVVGGTLLLAAVAVLQETIRGWFYRPNFRVSIKTEPPDCVSIPLSGGNFVADCIYLRLWVENIGNATANNAEVYAQQLRRKRLDGKWERVGSFTPMNLKWANIGSIYFPMIAPEMGKHCDLGHIIDPAGRSLSPANNAPNLGLTAQQTSLAFDLMVVPNNKSHIIGPGEYELDILVAAQNARPTRRTVAIALKGTWDADETRMLRDGVGVTVS